MRSYQEEIDRLTNRAQYKINYNYRESEIAFLNIYKSLYEAPDPVEALVLSQQIATQYQTKTIENEKLKKEVNEYFNYYFSYSSEISSLQNQDITIRNLQTRLEHIQNDFQNQIDNKVSQKLKEANDNYQKMQSEYEQRESQLKLQLQKALQDLDILRLTNQNSTTYGIDVL